MKSGSKKKTQGGSSIGGSRLITYALVGVMVVLVGYYVVLPAVTPKSTATVTTSASSGKVSFNTSSDISGASILVTASNLAPRQNLTATFGSNALQLINSSTGATYCTTNDKGAVSGCMFWVPKASSGSYRVTLTASNTSAIANFTIPRYVPPVSTMLVTTTSVALGLVTQLVTKRVVDLNAERRMRAEVNAFQKEKREATLAKDKEKLDKLKKRELAVQQEQLRVQRARLKVTAVTFVPLLVVYYLMASFLGGYGVIVAFTPIPIPIIAAATQHVGVYNVSLVWWYFLSSFAFSTMLGRLLHTTP
ncbi:MAG: DUF106 domain-containing protein [Nitrososphaerota archaeon]|jgi:uncharacterized membrane protein (DUF106 family)|nr:DUF106 domain-containing protein [Nitrososphaerota archaeon]MDG6942144.1 DUF106 domain-containing protein [Nitrososphaerota archaeon]MDG6942609.1 DUF106 domain-containing protein [Nitrososphaerota archaeon]MDG6948396.1 DUF106 domain-containing protein [Nitrososphaerota archaeon]MDG6950322.1 DUF106 domain-containing protein [Nitrososphaerota archaeon]